MIVGKFNKEKYFDEVCENQPILKQKYKKATEIEEDLLLLINCATFELNEYDLNQLIAMHSARPIYFSLQPIPKTSAGQVFYLDYDLSKNMTSNGIPEMMVSIKAATITITKNQHYKLGDMWLIHNRLIFSKIKPSKTLGRKDTTKGLLRDILKRIMIDGANDIFVKMKGCAFGSNIVVRQTTKEKTRYLLTWDTKACLFNAPVVVAPMFISKKENELYIDASLFVSPKIDDQCYLIETIETTNKETYEIVSGGK